MGNAIYPCFQGGSKSAPCFQGGSKSAVRLIFWEGNTRVLNRNHVAGEIMFEFPDRMVCHADSFYIGHPIPILALDDELVAGQTYFVLPLDRFSCTNVFSAATLAALVSSPNNPSGTRRTINFKEFSPFEYMKNSDGRVLIKVMPEFMTRLITQSDGDQKSTSTGNSPTHEFLCSTPELKKQYDQLVGSKEQLWSPKLESISEYKIRYSPCRFIGLERKLKEEDA